MAKQEIDLRNCTKGDLLISTHGAILEYVGPTKPHEHYDHNVNYIFIDGEFNTGQLGGGTRNDDGSVFKKNKMESDHDIVAIIPGHSIVKTTVLEQLKKDSVELSWTGVNDMNQ